VPERTGVSEGYAWTQKQTDFIRSLDNTRFLNASSPAVFEGFIPSLTESGFEKLYDFLTGEEPDPQKDLYGSLTEPFFSCMEVAGYNYVVKRYEADGVKFPGRIIAGTETFPHMAYVFWDATARLPYVIGDFVWTALDYLGESGIGKVSFDGDMMFGAPYPYHLANCGDFDICGFKRPQSNFRDLLWGVRTLPFMAVLDPQHYGKQITFNPWGWEPVIDSWAFPGQVGKTTQVDIYSIDDEVELLINGVSVGRKPAGIASQNKAVFEVTYQPGTIEAVGYTNGKETGRSSLVTTSEPVALRLTPDRSVIHSEFGDLSYIMVEIVDLNGNTVKYADTEVKFELTGPGELIAVGTANPISEELYVGNQRRAFQGRLMAVIRSSGETGQIDLKVQAEGLTDSEIQLRAI
jgi:beta-galactosidase